MRRYLFLLMMLLPLGSCAPSRQQADIKLAVACEAAIHETFTDPKDHISVTSADFSFKKSYDGNKLRIVTLKAAYTYGASPPDTKTYSCAYTEEWSLFSYLPEFYQLERDGQQFGNFSGAIQGDPEVLSRINDVTEKALK